MIRRHTHLHGIWLITLLATSVGAQGSFTSTGKACPGAKGLPILGAAGTHKIGGSSTLRVAPLQPNQGGMFFVGTSDRQWGATALPLDLSFVGMQGCKLNISPDLFTLPAPSNSSGVSYGRLLWPDNLQFVGLTLYVQHMALDPHTKTLTKLILSNGGKITLGCNDGRSAPATSGFQVFLPSHKTSGFPGMPVVGRYSGLRYLKCCSRFSRTRICSFESKTGVLNGSVSSMPLAVSRLASSINSAVLSAMKKVTGGSLSASTLVHVSLASLGISGPVSVIQNKTCTVTHQYTGKGTPRFGAVVGSATVKASIKIGFVKKSFSISLPVSATPTGSWVAQGSSLSLTMSIPKMRFRGSKKIPIINKTISFDTNHVTTFLDFTSRATLPRPRNCN